MLDSVALHDLRMIANAEDVIKFERTMALLRNTTTDRPSPMLFTVEGKAK